MTIKEYLSEYHPVDVTWKLDGITFTQWITEVYNVFGDQSILAWYIELWVAWFEGSTIEDGCCLVETEAKRRRYRLKRRD